MEDPNSLETVQKRAMQEDPIIMYLIVRESLNMSIGKTAAQCAHAAQILTLKYFDPIVKNDISILGLDEEKQKLFKEWLLSSFRKVVLRADEKEWLKIKNEFSPNNIALVIDAGLTELEPNTETVIGLSPMRKSQVPKLIKRLQVLK